MVLTVLKLADQHLSKGFPLLASTTQFVTGTGSSRRAIELKAIYDELGEATAAALLAFTPFLEQTKLVALLGRANLLVGRL